MSAHGVAFLPFVLVVRAISRAFFLVVACVCWDVMLHKQLKTKVKSERVESDDEGDGNADIFSGLHFILIEKGIGAKQASILKTQIETRGEFDVARNPQDHFPIPYILKIDHTHTHTLTQEGYAVPSLLHALVMSSALHMPTLWNA